MYAPDVLTELTNFLRSSLKTAVIFGEEITVDAHVQHRRQIEIYAQVF